ncbi:Abhydrolase domain-containing protein 16A [Folsomia candida]|uniref:Abhydrolase domain-containing protein 16A n=2 Tax=Folsomia candida TaxID=158441 RepID=A0A226DPN5_FOLCA|nr:Abhydrolase domain-containing protein 16A [Folsomia candida]
MGNIIFTPALYQKYNEQNRIYEGNLVEKLGNCGFNWSIPVGLLLTCLAWDLMYILYTAIAFVLFYIVRILGRWMNPTYREFMNVLDRAHRTPNIATMEELRNYDFQFKYWPVSYNSIRRGELYEPPFSNERANLIVAYNAVRSKIVTAQGDMIDTLFFDRRRVLHSRTGKTLVICVEGNASFAENGLNQTAIANGYSVLSYNRPGFVESTGLPYQINEVDAAEGVYDFARQSFKFNANKILIYGWSIGGYAAAHLASHYQNVKGLMLDGTFDELLEVALQVAPWYMSKLVRVTIGHHFNLNVVAELLGYDGPLRIFRRTNDQIMALPGITVSENRANVLLTVHLRQKYPLLFDNQISTEAFRAWLNQRHVKTGGQLITILNKPIIIPIKYNNMTDLEKSTLLIKIAEKTLVDFDADHNDYLPNQFFLRPWAPAP